MSTSGWKSEIPWRSLSIGSVLYATSAAFDRLHVGPWWLQFSLFACALFVVMPVGVVAILRAVTPREERRWKRYRCRELKLEELEYVYRFLRRVFPDEYSTVEQMASWLKVNPRLFWVIESRRPRNGADAMVGFFEILPLKAGAQRLVHAGQLDGLALKPEHLTRKKGTAAAVYVGSLVATEHVAKAYVLKQLDLKLKEYRRKPKKLLVYARPVTPEGYRLMRKYRFKCVHDGEPLEVGSVGHLEL